MSSPAPARNRPAPSLGCGYFLVGVLGLGGIACLLLAASRLRLADQTLPPGVWAPALVGLALLVGAASYARLARRLVREHAEDERRRAAHPTEPWLWERVWLGDHIEADDRKGLGVLWFFTVVWNSIAFPALYQVLREAPRDKAAYVVLLFPLVGLGLLSSAIYLTARARKYGRVRFAPVSLPGVVGGHLGGVIEVPARVVALGDLRLALRCIHRKTTGSGKNRRVVENTLWEAEQTIPQDRQLSGLAGTEIPVLFPIPPSCASTSLEDRNDQTVWRLTASAETPGVDFAATFSVPVFPVGDSASRALSDTAGADASRTAPALVTAIDPDAPALPEATLARAGVERLIDGWRFHGRTLRLARWISTGIFAAIIALMAVLVINDAPGVVMVMIAIFALIAAFVAYDMWHDRFTVRVIGDEVVISESVWFTRRDTRVPRPDIADLRVEKGFTVGATQYYRFVLVGRPVGDPPCPPAAREPFRTRKARQKLQTAAPDAAVAARARLASQPRFELRCAGHLPSLALATRLRAELLARLV